MTGLWVVLTILACLLAVGAVKCYREVKRANQHLSNKLPLRTDLPYGSPPLSRWEDVERAGEDDGYHARLRATRTGYRYWWEC